MRFNRDKFFAGYRSQFGALSQSQVDGLNRLLAFIEADRYVKTVETAAFLLATPKHETADTFKPIHEYGGKAYFIRRYGGQTRKGKELGNDTPEEGYYYAGKGYPQTTGESNYERLEDALKAEYPEVVAEFERRTGRKFDLTVGDQPNDAKDPQNMLDPAIAYVSMSYGSRVGLFTGRKLSDYDLRTPAGRKNSRRVINGLDKADLIAGYILAFTNILKASKTSAAASDAQTPTGNKQDEGQGSTSSQSNQSGQEQSGSPPIETVPVTAPEPYMGVGFWGVIKRDLAAATGGNLSFTALSEYAQQASGWPEWVVGIVTKLAIGALVVTVGYFIFRVVHYLVDTWKKDRKVQTEAAANTSKDRFNIEWL